MSESAGRVVAEVVDALGTGLLIPQWIGDVENPFPVGTKLVPEQLLVDLEMKVRALADRWEERALEVDSYADSAEDRMVSVCLNSAADELRRALTEKSEETR